MGFGELTERDDAVGADDFGGGDIEVPIIALSDGVPLLHGTLKGDGGQCGAIVECRLPDGGHAIRNGNGGQCGAIGECRLSDGGHAVGNGDGGQRRAEFKRTVLNFG